MNEPFSEAYNLKQNIFSVKISFIDVLQCIPVTILFSW